LTTMAFSSSCKSLLSFGGKEIDYDPRPTQTHRTDPVRGQPPRWQLVCDEGLERHARGWPFRFICKGGQPLVLGRGAGTCCELLVPRRVLPVAGATVPRAVRPILPTVPCSSHHAAFVFHGHNAAERKRC